MNWYKTSQQMLMFYPWQDKAYNVEQKVPPTRRDNLGNDYYNCSVCGKEIQESEIADWIKSEKPIQYKYPIHDIDPEIVKSGLKQVAVLLSPHITQFESREIDHYAPILVPDVQNFIKNNSQLLKYMQFISNVGMPSSELRTAEFILTEILQQGQIGGHRAEAARNVLSNIDTTIKEVDSFLAENSNFEVAQTAPICQECKETFPKCVSCDQIITDKQRSVEMQGSPGNFACEKCIENGRIDICDQCGEAIYTDEAHYNEDVGTLCDDCNEKLEEDYESSFANSVERLGRDNPRSFSKWLEGEERIFIPFESKPQLDHNDNYVINIIKDNGWDVTPESYRQGLAFRDYTTTTGETKKRSIKIGKLLQTTYDKAMKSEKDQNKRAELSSMYQYALTLFNKSESRKARRSSDMMIAISQNPHDIAKMTTGRNWTSCMRLTNRREDVFCEVEDGGLIAYLVQKDDEDIEKPLARVLIRRYENEDGNSIAQVEKNYYGTAPSGFIDSVKTWVDSKQGEIPKGTYRVKGMSYVDTLPERL